jgi:hypothetical protein
MQVFLVAVNVFVKFSLDMIITLYPHRVTLLHNPPRI